MAKIVRFGDEEYQNTGKGTHSSGWEHKVNCHLVFKFFNCFNFIVGSPLSLGEQVHKNTINSESVRL